MSLRALAVFVAAASLSACMPRLKDAAPDRPPADDEVVLVGEVDFDPAVNPPGPPEGIPDSGGVYTHYMIGFGDSAEPVTAWDKVDHVDSYAAVLPGRPFALIAPRHPTYVKIVRSYAHRDEKESWSLLGGDKLTITEYVVACLSVLQIPIQPGDRYVYVGHLICKHGDDGEAHLVVDPSRADITDALPGLIGDHKLVNRVPRARTASSASSSSL